MSCSIFDIGEIVDIIASRLDSADLARCLRVSRKCHAAFASHLYRKLSTLKILYLSHVRSETVAATFARYGALVRDLTVVHPNDLFAVGNHMPHLERFQISTRSYGAMMYDFVPSLSEDGASMGDTLWETLCQSAPGVLDATAGLLHFESDTCGDHGGRRDLLDFRQLFLHPNRLCGLISLSLSNFCYGTRTILDILAHCSQLRHIAIRSVGHLTIDHLPDNFQHSYALESANIGDGLLAPDLVLFNLMLWTRCPRLTSLEISGVTALTIAIVLSSSMDLFHEDERIDCLEEEEWTFGDIDRTIRMTLKILPSHNIQSLTLSRCSVGNGTLSLLLSPERCLRLRDLSLEGCLVRIPSRSIQAILASCPSLTHLRVGASALDMGTTTTLAAQDIINFGPWVCQNLTLLKVPIVGLCCSLPSSHDSDGFHDGHGHDHTKCRHLERQVYRQLGQMTHLRTLQVGRDVTLTRFGNQSNTYHLEGALSFSLANGLCELSTLRKLEHVDVSYAQHAIGLPEVQWMAKHWPGWHFMGGLNPKSEAGAWLQRNKPGFLFF